MERGTATIAIEEYDELQAIKKEREELFNKLTKQSNQVLGLLARFMKEVGKEKANEIVDKMDIQIRIKVGNEEIVAGSNAKEIYNFR